MKAMPLIFFTLISMAAYAAEPRLGDFVESSLDKYSRVIESAAPEEFPACTTSPGWFYKSFSVTLNPSIGFNIYFLSISVTPTLILSWERADPKKDVNP